MAIVDVAIRETGNGGDAQLIGRDFRLVSGWENMVYLAMFGGSVEQDTPEERTEGEELFDWWGNTLLDNESDQLFNSVTERTLNEVPLNSSGRLKVEQAVLLDLDFMRDFANISVETEITGVDRLSIRIKVIQPDSLQEQVFIYLWDGVQGTLSAFNPSEQGDFNNDFNLDFDA
jgi:hypothetical protein